MNACAITSNEHESNAKYMKVVMNQVDMSELEPPPPAPPSLCCFNIMTLNRFATISSLRP